MYYAAGAAAFGSLWPITRAVAVKSVVNRFGIGGTNKGNQTKIMTAQPLLPQAYPCGIITGVLYLTLYIA